MNLLKNSFAYGTIALLQKALAFLLLPLYTYFLNPSDYGTISVITSLVAVLSVFFSLSLQSAISRFYYECTEESEKKDLLGTIVVTLIVLSLVLGSILLFFGKQLLEPVLKNIKFMPYVVLGILSCVFTPLYQTYQIFLQVTYQAKKFSLNGLMYFICNTIFAFFLIAFVKLKAEGMLLANAITSFLFFLFAAFSIKPYITLKINFRILKKSILYCLPLVPHSLSGWIMSFLDRIFVNGLINSTSAGVFSVGAQFGSIVGIANQGITQAYSPWLMEILASSKNEKKLEQYRRFSVFGISLLCIMSLGLSLFSPFLFQLILPDTYRSAYIVIPFLAFGAVFNGLYTFNIGMVFFKNSNRVPIVTFIAASFSLILNIVFIRKYGFFGASISNLISNIVSAVMAIIISKNTLNIKMPTFEMITIIIISFMLSLYSFMTTVSLTSFLISIILFFAFLALLVIKYKSLISMFLSRNKREV